MLDLRICVEGRFAITALAMMAGIEFPSDRPIDCLAEGHLLCAGAISLSVRIIGGTQFPRMVVACLNKIGRRSPFMNRDHRTRPLG